LIEYRVYDGALMNPHWSYSRSKKFRDCNRQVFYDLHYNHGVGNSNSKKSIPAWKFVGDTVHGTIQRTLEEQLEIHGPLIDDMPMFSWNRMMQYYDDIADDILSSSNEDPYEIYDRLNLTVKKHLKNWKKYFRHNYRGHKILNIEEEEAWEYEGVEIKSIIDLLTAKEDAIYITDWKTNRITKSTQNDPQLMTYRIWAEQKYPDYSDYRCFFFYTKSGRVSANIITTKHSEELKNRIITDRNEWASENIENYPTNPSKMNCNYCKWSPICDDAVKEEIHYL